ncbi:hypothetical protein CVCC1112_1415 [Paenarthrobacter nicotinovorans]|nr:hypothetical protein CVCC1112_1415 [Paenarthrobacter nicotinovorans]
MMPFNGERLRGPVGPMSAAGCGRENSLFKSTGTQGTD